MSGYIKLHRAIENHWLWLDPRHLQWWLQLLFMAAWEPKTMTFGTTTVSLKRGQIATTTRFLMKKFMCANQTVFNFLDVLENEKMITREANAKRTIITIVNYDLYQQDSPPSKGAKPYGSVERKPNRRLEQTKEVRIEEEKKLNIISPSRESDLNFFEDFIKDEVYFEQVAMTIHVDLNKLRELAAQFKLEMLTKEKFHPSLQEYKQHFFNWAKLNIQKGGGTKKINLNEDKHNARRSAPVAVRDFDSDDETF